jgi:nitrate/nitrite transport system substrate-binding protein
LRRTSAYTSINTQAIWKDHPEKVCAFTEEFAAKNPKTVKAVLKALHEASVWLDKMENREEQANIVSAATYINCPPETILGRLQGKYDMGDGRKFKDPNYMIFSDRNCNYPQPKYASGGSRSFAAGASSKAHLTMKASPSRSCALTSTKRP